MTYLTKNRLIVLVPILFVACAVKTELPNKIESGSTLACMQGVWSPLNSQNEGVAEYIIYSGFNAVYISYTNDGKLEAIMHTVDGFCNLPEGYSQADSIDVADFQSSGEYYVSVFSDGISSGGRARLGAVQHELLCEGSTIEMADNNMTILGKQSYLPYTAYSHLKKQGSEIGEDYITQYNVLSKIKRGGIRVDKSYFHNHPSEASKRKAFVVKDDTVIIDRIEKGWVKVAYEGAEITTEGWLRRADVQMSESGLNAP